MNLPDIFFKQNDFLDKMPIGLLVLRQDLVVVAWNIRLEQWTGLRKSDIIRQDITVFYPNIKHPQYLSRLKSIFEDGPPVVFSAQFHKHFLPCRLPEGNLRVQHTTVTPLKTPAGEILAMIAIEDVTELTKRIYEIKDLHRCALVEIEERKKIEEEREDLIVELKEALSKIRTLSGLLPICSSCKRIRNDQGYWEQIESYVRDHSDAEFTHGYCPECTQKLYPEFFKK